MSIEHWRRLQAIYDAVLDAPAADRQRILDEACGADQALRDEVETLLAAHDAPDSFLDSSPARVLRTNLQTGDVLCERFVVLRRLGGGGMGEVWAATDQHLGEFMAIKTIVPALTADPAGLARFRREIQLARRIAHPNVCRVHELLEDKSITPPRLFLTMEQLEGETLAERLKGKGAIPPVEALLLFQQITAGLSAAHAAGVVHRDLKPSNIMLTGSESRRVVIMDFGLARELVWNESQAATQTGSFVGTPEYMAPEQISGSPATPQTDIYALGLILFEMLRGRRPFSGSNTLESWMRRARETPEKMSGVVPGVARRIDDTIARCLEFEPAARFKSADDVWAAVSRGTTVHVPVRITKQVAAIAALLIAAAVGWAVWQSRSAATETADAVRWYADAQQALAEGASVRALNAMTRALADSPNFAAARAGLAEIYLELDMPARAQETMLQPGGGPTGPDADYVNGIRGLLLRDCDEAVRSLESYARRAQGSERPYRLLTLSRALDRCGRTDQAQAALTEAAGLDPQNAAVAVRQAWLMARRRDFAGAMASLETAETLFRDRTNIEGVAEVLVARGSFESDQELLEQAEATLAKAAEIARSLDDLRQQVRVRLQQAIVFRKRGDVAAADRLTTEAIDLARRQSLDTLTLEGLFAAGNVQVIRNQFKDAQSLFERALTIAENFRHDEYRARAWLSLASVFVRVMEPAKAADAIQAARPYYERVKEQRYVSTAEALMGQVRLMRAEYPEAIQQFEAEVARAAKSNDREQEVTARENLATARAAIGRYPDALDEYQRVLSAHRSSGRRRNEAFALLNIADILSRMGRFPQASLSLNEAVKVVPDAPEIRSLMFLVRSAGALREGRLGDASGEAARVLEVGAGLSTERMVRANLVACSAAARAGRYDEARRRCDTAVAATPAGYTTLWLETRLVATETAIMAGNRSGLDAQVGDVMRVIERSNSSADRWRALALSATLAPRPVADEARGRVTRELDALRLLWGEANYRAWFARPDVRALLAMAGI